jgi:hypothetical protein
MLIHRSRQYVFTLTTNLVKKKVFRIWFGKDGSIYIASPYFLEEDGILSRVIIDAGEDKYPRDISLGKSGKVTTHLVKYSHHASGEALFSQDRKIKSEIRKPSVPLNSLEGHFFTIQIQNIDNFADATPKDKDKLSKKRTVYNVNIYDIDKLMSLKIVGRRYHISNLKKTSFNNNQPIIKLIMPLNNGFAKGFALFPPEEYLFSEYFIFVSFELISRLSKDYESVFSFIGGFDDKEIINDYTKNTSFLAMSYPINNIDRLLNEIGSVDYYD